MLLTSYIIILPKTVKANFTSFKTCIEKNNTLLIGFLCTQHLDAMFMFSFLVLADYLLLISKNRMQVPVQGKDWEEMPAGKCLQERSDRNVWQQNTTVLWRWCAIPLIKFLSRKLLTLLCIFSYIPIQLWQRRSKHKRIACWTCKHSELQFFYLDIVQECDVVLQPTNKFSKQHVAIQ